MKRSFSDIDELLPKAIDIASNHSISKFLDRIGRIEDEIDEKLNNIKRVDYAINTSPTTHTRILRNYIRHEYSPGTIDDEGHEKQGYFLVYVEGHILDKDYLTTKLVTQNKSPNSVKYGTFWEKIRLHVDKKGLGPQYQNGLSMEWSLMENNQVGMKADCFKFFVPNIWTSKSTSEVKNINAKLIFHRSNDFPRYELDPLLKKIFPYMRVDPTENDILTAVWEYLRSNNLIDRRYIRANDDMRPILGAEMTTVGSLRSKIMEHVFPSRPIIIEYNLTYSNSSIPSYARHTPSSYSKYNAKMFDIEIDIDDNHSAKQVLLLNDLVKHEEVMDLILAKKYNRCAYIMKAIIKRRKRIKELKLQAESIRNKMSNEKGPSITLPTASGILDHLSYPDSLFTQLDPIQDIRNRPTAEYLIDFAKITEKRKAIKHQIEREKHFLLNPTSDISQLRAKLYLQSDSTNEISSSSSAVTSTESKVHDSKTLSASVDDIRQHFRQQPLLLSAIHSLRGFLDVGDDKLFQHNIVAKEAQLK